MKNIQIKIGNNITTFHNEKDVISFMTKRLSKNNKSVSYSSRLINELKQTKRNPNRGTVMTMEQCKEYLMGAQD